MGIGFTIVIWGIIFSVLAVVLGILAALGVRICCKPKGRGQKMVLAFLTPGLAIFVYAVCSVLYMAMISIVFHVDLGIGDSWYVPLNKVYSLSSVDYPENGSITKGNEVVLAPVTKVQIVGHRVIGKGEQKYFIFDLNTGKVSYAASIQMLQKQMHLAKIDLVDNNTFYWEKRKTAYIIGGVLCLMITLLVVVGYWKVGLYK